MGRVTVYRHFPDEAALWRACSGHYLEQNPLPDLEAWPAVADPGKRLRTALRETYAYHRANEAMFARALADVRDHPVMAPYHEHWQGAADGLVEPWPVRGRQRTLLRAGIALALNFDAWRTRAREQMLTDDQAVELMYRLTCTTP